jgi:SSS family solute:Na+ symporter
MIAYVSMNEVSGGRGVIAGFTMVLERAPEKFDMILSKDNPSYAQLPGISVLVGGMWIMNLSYWGFNQYIIQRALAAKDNREAQKGIVFAAFLKMLMPILVVLPGIAAVILAPGLSAPDQAYPEVMKLLPAGLTGLVFAALIAAIVSSLASMMNSISTIFTMDVYRHLGGVGKSEHQLVTVGRTVSLSAIIVAAIVARPLLGKFDQAFQYIQEFTGFFTPGVVAIFLLAIFWKKTTANGALGAAIGSALLSLWFYIFWPSLPFIDRVGIVFVLCVAFGMMISGGQGAGEQSGAIHYKEVDTSTTTGFNLASLVIALMLTGLYVTWW